MVKRRKEGRWKIILAAVAVVVVIVIVAVVAGFAWRESYEDGYFVSDETKLVLGMDDAVAALEEGEYEPEVTYMVYYYDGDTINGMKVFFKYEDANAAKVAEENIDLSDKKWATDKSLSGKYVVFGVKEDQYKELKASYVRKMIDDMREAGTLYENL